MTVAIGFTCMIAFTIAANLLMKFGAMGTTNAQLAFGLINWRTLSGLACFGVAGLLYAWLLRYVALHVAQSFAAAQYVGVIVASAVVLPDPISPLQWVGIAMIGSGVVLVGSTIA